MKFGKNVFGAKSLFDIFIANSWQQTLGSFALMQLMLFPLAFNLLYPVNVRDTSEVAIETAAMDIFPTQDVLESNFDFESIDPPNPRLVMLGYDSSQFALNAGTSLIIFIVHLGLIGLYFLLEPFRLWICKG